MMPTTSDPNSGDEPRRLTPEEIDQIADRMRLQNELAAEAHAVDADIENTLTKFFAFVMVAIPTVIVVAAVAYVLVRAL